jgi:group I intron endonuclease
LATVITNLLSAIPIFGQDIVESKNITELSSCFFFNEDFNTKLMEVLPTVGIVSHHALKKGNKLRTEALKVEEYLSIPYQFIAFLAGFIDGDGYFPIIRTTKGFISIKLVITLSLEDLSTLEYIHSVLKLGKLTIRRDIKNPTCSLIINRTDLQEIIFPLFIHHGIFFLTDRRRAQFDKAIFILKNDIKLYDQISNIKEIPLVFPLPLKPTDYLELVFFKNWLVGFTNAEGSFFMKINKDGCFQIKQRIHYELFEAIKLLFNTNRNIGIEKDKYAQFSVSSKKDIQKVIDFFSFSGLHPLTGRRLIEYLRWKELIESSHQYKEKSSQLVNYDQENTVKMNSIRLQKNDTVKFSSIISINFFSYQYIYLWIYIVFLIINYKNLEIFSSLTIFNKLCTLNMPLTFFTKPRSNYIVFYANADKEKATVIKDNRKLSGIYKWTHKESSKSYIGSSINLGQRFASYFNYNWISGQAKHSIICKSLLKYGYSEFSLEILEYCNKEDTIKREQFYIDSLKPEYNILKIAGSRLGSKHSKSVKDKIKLALTGRSTSDFTKSKQRAIRLGFRHSNETKAKLKEHLTNLNTKILAKKKGIKVSVLDLETKITSEYNSIRKAAKEMGSHANSLLRHEKLQLEKDYTKPFKDRYVIVILRK